MSSYQLKPNTSSARESLLARVVDNLIGTKIKRSDVSITEWESDFGGITTCTITIGRDAYTLGVTTNGTASLILSVGGKKGEEQNLHAVLGE